jgi:hypothetical protein
LTESFFEYFIRGSQVFQDQLLDFIGTQHATTVFTDYLPIFVFPMFVVAEKGRVTGHWYFLL